MRTGWLLAALLPVLVAGVAFAQVEEPAPDPNPSAPEYVIGVEDVLRIAVWGEPEISQTVQVRPDGVITLPLVDDIRVVGQTPAQVRRSIAEALQNFVRDPSVTVIVEQINSYQVFFLGEVSTQGRMQFYRPIRLLQAIATAGGLTEFAKKEIVLLREEYGVEKRIVVDYKKLINGDPSQENIVLKSGDTLLFF
jgi:polysaccharide export outer membrane protein